MSDATARAEDKFAASLTHEIRTPLNGILGMASLLAETELSPAQAEYVAAIRESGARLLDLLNNVLDFARLEADAVDLERVPVDPVKAAQDVVELLSPRAHQKGVDLAVLAPATLPDRFDSDDGRLRQILFNLIGNAIKFTDTGGVLIELAATGDTLAFHIHDSGPGIAPGAQASLFAAFQQTSAQDALKDRGVGLGLAISRRLTEALGGELTLSSAPGNGTTFTARFPARTETPPQPAPSLKARIGLAGVDAGTALSLTAQLAPLGITLLQQDPSHPRALDGWIVDARLAASSIGHLAGTAPCLVLLRPEDRSQISRFREQGAAGYLLRPIRAASVREQVRDLLRGNHTPDTSSEPPAETTPRRILVADDNPINALLATRALERDGHICSSVQTGGEALDAVGKAPFDIILMDLRMPVMDGFSAARALRARGEKLPIIAVSAEVNPDIERDAIDAGMNAIAAKPLDAAGLRSIVERWTTNRS